MSSQTPCEPQRFNPAPRSFAGNGMLLLAVGLAVSGKAQSQIRPFSVFAVGRMEDAVVFISSERLRQAWPLITIETYHFLIGSKRSSTGVEYEIVRHEVEVDCNARTSRLRRFDRLDGAGRLLQRSGLLHGAFESAEAGSLAQAEVRYACDGGRPASFRSFTSLRDARAFARALFGRRSASPAQ